MYLEISGRQTGKTFRLINQIYADKDKYDLQILMGMNWNSLNLIKKQIKKNNKLKICLSYESFKEVTLGYKNIRLYVDEFLYSTSFCNNFKEFKNNYFDIIENGYYASSINTNMERYQTFFDLKQINGFVSSMQISEHDFI